MTNHPNRSRSAALRYVVYSLASHTALCWNADSKSALDAACERHNIDSDFLVVFVTKSKDDIDRFDGARLPKDAKIVWRGTNELSRRFRSASLAQ